MDRHNNSLSPRAGSPQRPESPDRPGRPCWADTMLGDDTRELRPLAVLYHSLSESDQSGASSIGTTVTGTVTVTGMFLPSHERPLSCVRQCAMTLAAQRTLSPRPERSWQPPVGLEDCRD